MAYQYSRVFQFRSHPYETSVVIPFNTKLQEEVFHNFHKSISLKVNLVAQQVCKVSYFEDAVQKVSHCVTRASPYYNQCSLGF